METDDHDGSTQNLQKQHVISEDGDHDQDQSQQAQAPSPISSIRSYECTFCKRGFSNAQALGGHMNIHRKHKAKLKQSSSSKDITAPHQQQQLQPISNLETLHSPTKTKPSWPWNVVPFQEHDRDQTNPTPPGAMKQAHHIPLFVERPSDKDDQTGHLSTSEQQLDLELRLGPEPNKDSTSTPKGTTRKFF